jgi:hypothetical protein
MGMGGEMDYRGELMKSLAAHGLAVAFLGGCALGTRPATSMAYPYPRYEAAPFLYPATQGPFTPVPLNAVGAMLQAPAPVAIGLGLGMGLSNIMVEKERYEAATGGDRPIEAAESPPARLARLQGEARRNSRHADAWEVLGDEQVRQGHMADAAKSYQTALPLERDKKRLKILKYKLDALRAP